MTSTPDPHGQGPYGSGSAAEPWNAQDGYPQSSGSPAYPGQAYPAQPYQEQQPYQGQFQQPYPQYQAGQYPGAYPQPGVAQKSKMAAGLLAIFLGSLGIHNFYLGHTGRAVAQLLITVLSLGMLSWVSWIWAIIEGIQILTAQPGQVPWGVDANGYPLQA